MRLKPTTLLIACLLVTPFAQATSHAKTIFGLNEYVALPGIGIVLPAKLDTGAQTASLGARDIQRFERDDEPWVRFTLDAEDSPDHVLERPLARISKIKRRPGDFKVDLEKTYTTRPVVELEMCLGQRLERVEVNLTDRSTFEYPLLIGSDALEQFGALIDPSLSFAFAHPDCTDPVADE